VKTFDTVALDTFAAFATSERVILNEGSASQAPAVLRALGLPDDAPPPPQPATDVLSQIIRETVGSLGL
jgi:hypothetical protein